MRVPSKRQYGMPVIIGVALLIWVSASPARAFTCEDVRGLSMEEQNYWSQRLHLSSLQRHVIWVACYQKYRAPELHVAHR